LSKPSTAHGKGETEKKQTRECPGPKRTATEHVQSATRKLDLSNIERHHSLMDWFVVVGVVVAVVIAVGYFLFK
jgi:hypothetical protein